MIPVNNAIIVALVAVAVVAVIVFLAMAGYWRTRVDDAYQDGHAAGIATQIARQHRARDRRLVNGQVAGDPLSDSRKPAHEQLPAVIPFPEGLPPGLREYATQAMAAADAAQWAAAS